MEGGNFGCGLVFGLAAALVIGSIGLQIREARTRMGRQNRPMDTFPASVQPALTPAGVVASSQAAGCTVLLWALALGAAILLMGLVAYWLVSEGLVQ